MQSVANRDRCWYALLICQSIKLVGHIMSLYTNVGFCKVSFSEFNSFMIITFRVSRRRRKMYCGRSRASVCLSAATCLHYCTDTDVTWASGRGCSLVVRYCADLQSVNGLRCYGNTSNAWHSPAVISQTHRTPHALRTHACTSDKIDAPAACATLSATTPFHFVHTAGVL